MYISLLICYYLIMEMKVYSHITREMLEKMSSEELVNLAIILYNDNVCKNNIISNMTELRRMARAEKYEPSSEQMGFLFPELEIMVQYGKEEIGEEDEEEKSETPKKERKPRKPNLTAPADAPVRVIDNTNGVPATMEVEGIKYERGEDKVIYHIAVQPGKKIVEKNIFPTWVATCEVEKDEKKKIISFNNEKLDKLACSPSLLAKVATDKFDDHLPLYRQSEILERNGMPIARQTLSDWLMKYYGELASFDEYFGEQIFKMNMINQDETPLEVLSLKTESGRISSSSFVIIRVGTTYDKEKRKFKRVVYMQYSDGRSREQLFDGYKRNQYSGPLMTDGLKGYLGGPIDQDKHCVCWTHAVRSLKQYVRLNKKDSDINKILFSHAELYKLDSKFRELLLKGEISTDEFLAKRKAASTPVIDSIFESAKKTSQPHMTGARQKGINYLLEYKDHLYTYLDYVEAVPDNSECERRAKSFATGRKNWLFVNTIDGADASCFFYSLIETAKENGLNPEKYLEYILTYGPSTPKEKYDTLLPWNVDMSKIEEAIAARANAVPDPERKEPYILTGFSR